MANSGSVFSPRKHFWGVRGAFLVSVLVLALFVFQPDALAALTVFPTECWLLAGILGQSAWGRQCRRPEWILASCVWGLFALVSVEPLRSVPRVCLQPVSAPGFPESLRIVTLNCSGESGALNDILPHRPDLVLIQESPGKGGLTAWAHALFGDEAAVVSGRDCAILARGSLRSLPEQRDGTAVHAIWELPDGRTLQVTSLRLATPPVRFDFWTPGFWEEFGRTRRRQRQELQAICQQETSQAALLPVILGGDFNSPAGDAIDEVLTDASLRDCFRQSGRGWGKTITSAFPFHRIDRVFVSAGLQALDCRAFATQHTDHRLGMCEIVFPAREK
jgi:hypothetical protein